MTIGEIRVRTQFNPSASDLVSQIKDKGAELINMALGIASAGETETERLKSLAATHFEIATMLAVKAATVNAS